MKKEKGITLIVLVITIVILLVIMGVVFTVVSGKDGVMKKVTDTSFEEKIIQIDELINEKTTLFQLEEVAVDKGNTLLTNSVKLSILQEYYDVDNPDDPEKSKMDIKCVTNDDGEVEVRLYYWPSQFTADEIETLKEHNALELTETATEVTEEESEGTGDTE